MKTKDVDFNLDFSSKNGGGQVASLESFLAPIETPIDPPVIKPEDVIEPIVEPIDPPVDPIDPPVIKPEDVIEPIVEPIDPPVDPPVDPLDSITDDKLDYKTVISKLVESNIWDSIEAFETEDGEEVTFEDMDIDAETFIQIWKQKDSELRDSLLQDKISTENMSDFTKRLAEIDSNGGDVSQALESYKNVKNPLESLDMTNVSDQQTAIYLKLQSAGLDDVAITDVIKAYSTNGQLEDKALEAKKDLEVAFDLQMEAINQEAINRKVKQKDALKKYKGELKNQFSSFNVSDSYKKKVIELATKPDKDGRYELDNIYSEVRQNPEQAAELIFFLTDKEEYIKQLVEKEKKNINLGVMKKIKLVKKSSSNVKIEPDNSKSKRFIQLNEIHK